MGISGRQGRSVRNARSGADPRVEGRAGHHGEGALSRAVHLCFAYLWRISPFDAALCLPALGRKSPKSDACCAEVAAAAGSAHPRGHLSHARRRLAAYSHVARSAVKGFATDGNGTTAIEYG